MMQSPAHNAACALRRRCEGPANEMTTGGGATSHVSRKRKLKMKPFMRRCPKRKKEIKKFRLDASRTCRPLHRVESRAFGEMNSPGSTEAASVNVLRRDKQLSISAAPGSRRLLLREPGIWQVSLRRPGLFLLFSSSSSSFLYTTGKPVAPFFQRCPLSSKRSEQQVLEKTFRTESDRV